jgi:hypothetical protein
MTVVNRCAPGFNLQDTEGAIERLKVRNHIVIGTDSQACHVAKAAEVFPEAIATVESQLTISQILSSGERKATERELSSLLMSMVAAFPNNSHDLTAYGAVLADEVRAVRPSIYALSVTVRSVIRSRTFLPSVGEVLLVIDNSEAALLSATVALADLPKWVQRAAEVLAQRGRMPVLLAPSLQIGAQAARRALPPAGGRRS